MKAMELYKERSQNELTYTEERCVGKADENVVYKDRVDAAIQRIYIDKDEETN